MFVADEVLLELSFDAAAARLAEVARGGLLTRVSQGAYGDGVAGLARVGPLGAAPGVSTLVEVHFLDLAIRGECAVLALRRQATRPGGALFPALDGDLALTVAGEHATRLSLAGAYRPPLGPVGAGLDQAIFHKAAQVTVRSLLARVADTLTRPPGPGDGQETGMTPPAPRVAAPGQPGRGCPLTANRADGDRTARPGSPRSPGPARRWLAEPSRWHDGRPSAQRRLQTEPGGNSRRTTMSFMPAAIRSRSCVRHKGHFRRLA
jgi:hypothetical protein